MANNALPNMVVEITTQAHSRGSWVNGDAAAALGWIAMEVGTQPSQNCKYWQPSSVQMCLLFEGGTAIATGQPLPTQPGSFLWC